MRNYSIRPRDDGRAAKRVLAMPLARSQAWFDDEVAIDFPSLHGAVERMRASFVATLTEYANRRDLSCRVVSLAARGVRRRHRTARRAGENVLRGLRGARRGVVGSLRKLRRQRRSAWPSCCPSRRSATGAGWRSFRSVSLRPVRSAHPRRGESRSKLGRFRVPGSGFQVPGSRFRVPGSRFQVTRSAFQFHIQ